MDDQGSARVDVGRVLREHCRRVLDDFRRGEEQHSEDAHRGKEEAVRRILSDRLPRRYGVGHGIVVDTRGGQSRPFGALVFDHDRLPLVSGQGDLSIWPCESIYAAVDVRTELTRDGLESAVQSIAAFKDLQRERVSSVHGNHFTVSGEVVNPPIGVVVAERHADDLVPTDDVFQKIVESVEPRLRLDGYCIIAGAVGCLGEVVPGQGVLLGFSEAQRPTQLFHFRFGDGALAAFLLMFTPILNKIRLGDPSLVPYLRASLPY